MAVYNLATGNILTFGQATTTNIKWLKVEQTLAFAGSLQENMFYREVAQKLWFQQVVGVQKTLNLSAGNSLGFSQQTFPRALLESADSGLALIHWADVFINHPAESLFSLDQEVSYEISKYNPVDIFVLTQSVSYTIEKAFELEHTFTISQGVSVYKVNKNFIGPYEG